MTLNEHCFVREPPLGESDICPGCNEPWEFCSCIDLPEFADVLETYEKEPLQ